MDDLSFWDILARLGLALLLGGLIGIDRESLDKPAGLRTMMLVALGSAAFTLIGVASLDAARDITADAADAELMRLDTGRIIAGIVGGIGFLGAGAIIRSGGNVHGVTTASAIWATAAIGIAAALGLYTIALLTTGLAVVTLGLFHWLLPVHEKQAVPNKDTTDNSDNDE